ncbi:MAG: response regulator transcription factor [Chloroflexota bacterium]
MPQILIIDDDEKYLNSLKTFLEEKDYDVVVANNGKTGLKHAFKFMPDLIILDFVMPNLSGVQTCRQLRVLTHTPIIMLTARNDEASMVEGLEAGADDFLVKPCPHGILLAKMSAILRRAGTHGPLKANYDDGYLRLELTKGEVLINGNDSNLTSTEFRLLTYLFRNADRVVPHEELIKEVWGEHSTTDKRSLKLYVLYLRRKIEEDPDNPVYLKTAWGVGYRFELPENIAASLPGYQANEIA